MRKKIQKYPFRVVIEEDEDGFYAYCPQLEGCFTQGATYEEAVKNIQEAIELHVEDRLESGELWKPLLNIRVATLEVKA